MTRRTLLAFLLILGPALIWYLFIRPIPTEVTIYFTRVQDGEAPLAPVTRLVLARSVGTRLRGLAVAGDMVVVDLTADVERGGGSSSMLGRVWQIVFTGTQFSGVSRVRILIDGEARESMGGEGMPIEEPFTRPPSIPRF